MLYEVFDKLKIRNSLFLAAMFLFVWPRMWVVRSVGSPETLFILFIVLSLYAFQKKSYWLSAIAGALSVLTKSPGVLLFVAYGLWFFIDYLKTKKLNAT